MPHSSIEYVMNVGTVRDRPRYRAAGVVAGQVRRLPLVPGGAEAS